MVFYFHTIVMKYFPKGNDFILKKEEYGTTKTFKKTLFILKDFFGQKITDNKKINGLAVLKSRRWAKPNAQAMTSILYNQYCGGHLQRLDNG